VHDVMRDVSGAPRGTLSFPSPFQHDAGAEHSLRQLFGRRCQSHGGSSTRRAHAPFQMTTYAARACHSANAAERLCL
jgi:hypothetical protein